ncbi:acyl-CoA synthetase (AMP-forming)/AMP-acid ligase II [Bradyrhizobium sp. JR3.5]
MPVRYYDWIAHHRRRTPDKMALVDLASGRRFSYAELDARVSRLAGYLRDELKVASGDRVAVLALNTTDTLEVQFACFRIGGGLPAAQHPPHRSRAALHHRRRRAQGDDP